MISLPAAFRRSRGTVKALFEIALLAFAAGVSLSAGAYACGRATDCPLPEGSYRVAVPEGWDGSRPLPAALYFHGWQQTAETVLRDEALAEAFSKRGVLLVVPNGLNRTWTFPGSPQQVRDDVAFALAVLDDVEARFPIDRRFVWATGFSQGGSMTWWLACAAGRRFRAFAPFAGAFWEPIPVGCAAGPANLLHVHGLDDGTVPMVGRTVAGRFRQGDVLKGMAVWRRVNGCSTEEPEREWSEGAFACRAWTRCTARRVLTLCVHPGGHEVRPEWIANAWAFVQGAPDPDP